MRHDRGTVPSAHADWRVFVGAFGQFEASRQGGLVSQAFFEHLVDRQADDDEYYDDLEQQSYEEAADNYRKQES